MELRLGDDLPVEEEGEEVDGREDRVRAGATDGRHERWENNGYERVGKPQSTHRDTEGSAADGGRVYLGDEHPGHRSGLLDEHEDTDDAKNEPGRKGRGAGDVSLAIQVGADEGCKHGRQRSQRNRDAELLIHAHVAAGEAGNKPQADGRTNRGDTTGEDVQGDGVFHGNAGGVEDLRRVVHGRVDARQLVGDAQDDTDVEELACPRDLEDLGERPLFLSRLCTLDIKHLVDLASDVILLFITHTLEGANGLDDAQVGGVPA